MINLISDTSFEQSRKRAQQQRIQEKQVALETGVFGSEIHPDLDDTYTNGTVLFRWDAVYAANGTIQTSDLRLKDVQQDYLGLDFILALAPISWKWKNKKEGPTNYGLSAQQVQLVIKQLSINSFAGLVEDEELLSLRYDQFIGPLIAATKEQENEITRLRLENHTLEERVSSLELIIRRLEAEVFGGEERQA